MRDEPAFPRPGTEIPNGFDWPVPGLTIRQHFAILALQGMISNPSLANVAKPTAERMGMSIEEMQTKCAVIYADTLIAELSKS